MHLPHYIAFPPSGPVSVKADVIHWGGRVNGCSVEFQENSSFSFFGLSADSGQAGLRHLLSRRNGFSPRSLFVSGNIISITYSS